MNIEIEEVRVKTQSEAPDYSWWVEIWDVFPLAIRPYV